jgi:hypothetical protein
MNGFSITVTRSPDFKNIVIQDVTEWIEGSLEDLSNFVLSLYTTDMGTPYKSYTFTNDEVTSFTSTGTIILTFSTMFDLEYLPDNWYDVKLTADTDYVSNTDGFAIYAQIKAAVFINNLNNLHTPDSYRGSIEPVLMQAMFLKGLEYLDTGLVNNRRVKSLKRMRALLKMVR